MSMRDEIVKALRWRWLIARGRFRQATRSGAKDPTLAVYEQMRRDNEQARPMYQAGKMWGEINRQFSTLIYADTLSNVRQEYMNRRFAGPEPCSRVVYQSLLWMFYNKLLESDVDGFLKSESEPTAGGTYDQEIIDGRPMSLDFLQSVEEAFRLRDAWRAAGHKGVPELIVELGAGYGRLAYVARRMFPKSTYVILDLPEALICASAWLDRVLPGQVVPYATSRSIERFSRSVLLAKQVWTLGAHQIEQIDAGAVDAFVNVFSLSEMPRAAIDNYFSQVGRITSGIFFFKQRHFERNADDNVDISAESYPVSPNWYQVFHRPVTTLYQRYFESIYATTDATAVKGVASLA
jgi:putative sugar O-methyltransferase